MGDLLVWIDCEMTGLDLGRDALIEVAALVTDPDLNVLGDGVDVVIHAEDALLDSMFDVVREMHEKSGLTDQVRASIIGVEEAEDRIISYVTTQVPEPRSAPLCGNRALADIKESIRELEFYRRTVFVPQPGLDVDAAKAVAAQIAEERPIF